MRKYFHDENFRFHWLRVPGRYVNSVGRMNPYVDDENIQFRNFRGGFNNKIGGFKCRLGAFTWIKASQVILNWECLHFHPKLLIISITQFSMFFGWNSYLRGDFYELSKARVMAAKTKSKCKKKVNYCWLLVKYWKKCSLQFLLANSFKAFFSIKKSTHNSKYS